MTDDTNSCLIYNSVLDTNFNTDTNNDTNFNTDTNNDTNVCVINLSSAVNNSFSQIRSNTSRLVSDLNSCRSTIFTEYTEVYNKIENNLLNNTRQSSDYAQKVYELSVLRSKMYDDFHRIDFLLDNLNRTKKDVFLLESSVERANNTLDISYLKLTEQHKIFDVLAEQVKSNVLLRNNIDTQYIENLKQNLRGKEGIVID